MHYKRAVDVSIVRHTRIGFNLQAGFAAGAPKTISLCLSPCLILAHGLNVNVYDFQISHLDELPLFRFVDVLPYSKLILQRREDKNGAFDNGSLRRVNKSKIKLGCVKGHRKFKRFPNVFS